MAEASDHPRLRPPDTTGTQKGTVDTSRVVALYESHGAELRRFILGVTRDPELAADVLQTTYTKALELGHTARPETFKGWLFRVAFHEAVTARRRREIRDQANRRLASLGLHPLDPPDQSLIRRETVETVRRALENLPKEQRDVVWAR